MGNLLGSILSGANSLRAFSQGLNVTQSNVTNANTPGYVKQTQIFNAEGFDLEKGLPGGVSLGALLNSRNEFAEQSVRRQQSALGAAGQRSADLAQIQPLFDLTGATGVSGTLGKFFDSFSQLSINPNSNVSRQTVLARAGDLAGAIRSSANALGNAGAAADQGIKSTLESVNQLLDKLGTLNAEFGKRFDAGSDPGLDADLHQTLERLSEFVDFTALKADDGSTTVSIGGQNIGVIGEFVSHLTADLSGPQAKIFNGQGTDVTAEISSGKLSSLLKSRNETIPSYLNDLNALATTVADTVNSALAGGLDAAGNPPATPLFAYDPVNGAAITLSVNSLAPGDLAAASSTAPGGNGNALVLADLAHAKQIDGFTFTEFYGNLGGRVGRDSSTAQDAEATAKSLLTQAQSFRSDDSGVSIDEEAAKLVQFQKSYEATAKLLTILNDLTGTLIGIIR